MFNGDWHPALLVHYHHPLIRSVDQTIDPFNVCKHRKPRLGARAAWGQKNGAANRPAYCVKEKQTSLIDR